eukprot:Nitzschia sp. Nitz4//scaffold13_size275219//39226//40767//NITZ4_000844-RA/size275219-processed-gene-0.74-mRNA-1//1//CDS//3329535924//2077//frame0
MGGQTRGPLSNNPTTTTRTNYRYRCALHRDNTIAVIRFAQQENKTLMTQQQQQRQAQLTDPLSVREWLSPPFHGKPLAALDALEMDLRLGRLTTTATPHGPMDRRVVTVRTIELLKTMIGGTRWRTPAELVSLFRGLGRILHAAGGFREPAIGNAVRRVLAAIREEVMTQPTTLAPSNGISAAPTTPIHKSHDRSLQSLLWALPQQVSRSSSNTRRPSAMDAKAADGALEDPALTSPSTSLQPSLPPVFDQPPRPDLKGSIMEAIQEITAELEDLHKSINAQATQQIHAGEVILTYGRSETVELFLKAAADKKRRFTVIVCEGAPNYQGHEMAKSLAASGIEAICIPDSAICAMMARVNKVILPAHAVLANGGLIAPSGCNLVGLAASHNSVPIVVLTGLFKLTPLYPHDGQDTLNDFLSPGQGVCDYSQRVQQPNWSSVDWVNPVYDYIRPQLINLYVTNVGSFQPSYIYRLLAEYYHNDDWAPFQ